MSKSKIIVNNLPQSFSECPFANNTNNYLAKCNVCGEKCKCILATTEFENIANFHISFCPYLIQLSDMTPNREIYIWLDSDEAPDHIKNMKGFVHADTVNKVKNCILYEEERCSTIKVIDITDKLSYERSADGGTIMHLLEWLKDNHKYIPIHIHSNNPEKLQRLIKSYKLPEI